MFPAPAKRWRETARAAQERLAAPVQDIAIGRGRGAVKLWAKREVMAKSEQWEKLVLPSRSAQETQFQWTQLARSRSKTQKALALPLEIPKLEWLALA
jgi:hypothetical protein